MSTTRSRLAACSSRRITSIARAVASSSARTSALGPLCRPDDERGKATTGGSDHERLGVGARHRDLARARRRPRCPGWRRAGAAGIVVPGGSPAVVDRGVVGDVARAGSVAGCTISTGVLGEVRAPSVWRVGRHRGRRAGCEVAVVDRLRRRRRHRRLQASSSSITSTGRCDRAEDPRRRGSRRRREDVGAGVVVTLSGAGARPADPSPCRRRVGRRPAARGLRRSIGATRARDRRSSPARRWPSVSRCGRAITGAGGMMPILGPALGARPRRLACAASVTMSVSPVTSSSVLGRAWPLVWRTARRPTRMAPGLPRGRSSRDRLRTRGRSGGRGSAAPVTSSSSRTSIVVSGAAGGIARRGKAPSPARLRR